MSRRAWEDRLAAALTDLGEVAAQEASGEFDTATAEALRSRYEAEADLAREHLTDDVDGGLWTRRALIGATAFLVLAAVLVVAVVIAIEPRQGGYVTGELPTTGRDLSAVSNEELEEVVAANPSITPMRLALARRYVDSGEFSKALDHYFVVLNEGPNAEALAYVGWMAYLSGDAATGGSYLERSLDVDPEFGPALWFLAQLRWHVERDAPATVDLLERLLEGELPSEVRQAATGLLEEARASS